MGFQNPSRWSTIKKLPDDLRWRYWRKHRNSGARPIVGLVLDGLRSARFTSLLTWLVALAVLSPLLGVITRLQYSPLLSAAGLLLDIAGVLLIFKEWVLQHEENESRETAEIDRKVRFSTEEEPIDTEFIEEHGAAVVSRHLADGMRDRLNAHVVPALGGVVCLCLGFAYQLAGLLSAP